MSEPQTAAGRAVAARAGYEDDIVSVDDIRAIEDEAARKERARIAYLAERVGEGVGIILRAGDGRAYDPAVAMRNAIIAAITDTGEPRGYTTWESVADHPDDPEITGEQS